MDPLLWTLVGFALGFVVGSIWFAKKEADLGEKWGQALSDWDGADEQTVVDDRFYDQEREWRDVRVRRRR